MEMGELIMIEIGRDEYGEYIETLTRLSIITRLIMDEEAEGYSSISCKKLRAVLEMPRKGKDE